MQPKSQKDRPRGGAQMKLAEIVGRYDLACSTTTEKPVIVVTKFSLRQQPIFAAVSIEKLWGVIDMGSKMLADSTSTHQTPGPWGCTLSASLGVFPEETVSAARTAFESGVVQLALR